MTELEEKPNEENGEPDFEVEEILFHRDVAKTRQYFVSWVGYPESENSWINEEDMACSDLLEEYIDKLKKKQFKSKNLNKSQTITHYKDIVEAHKEIDHILELFRNLDGTFYKLKLKDDTIVNISSEELQKNNPTLVINFLETRLMNIDEFK